MAIEGIDAKGWKDIPLTHARVRLEKVMDMALDLYDMDVFMKNLPVEFEVLEFPSEYIDCEDYAFKRKGVAGRFARRSPAILAPEPGDVVFYCENNEMRHIGVMDEGDMVKSKWGTIGPVLRHPLELIPPDYGSAACFRRRGKHIRKARS